MARTRNNSSNDSTANLGFEALVPVRKDLAASPPFSASDGEKVAEGRMRCRRESGERAGVRCRNPRFPPKGNANFAWVQHFIHHLELDGNINDRQTLN